MPRNLDGNTLQRAVDPSRNALYSLAMAGEIQSNGIESDLARLERKVADMLHAYAQMKEENDSLRSRQASLMAERAALIEKTELARNRVEAMIARLKAMESNL